MSVIRITFPVLLLASVGCGALGGGGSAVELGDMGEAARSQWNATLSSRDGRRGADDRHRDDGVPTAHAQSSP